jgi:quercetin dioxygenase-like cupin family protein
MMASPEFRNREQAPVQERSDGVVIRRLVQGASMDVTEYTVPRGFTTGASDHEISEKAGYVVRGKVEISTEDGTFVVEAGGAYSLPVGVPHQFTVVEDSVIVQVRSPAAAPTAGSA